MPRLSSLYVCNNYISRISPIGNQLPSLTHLNLSNNKLVHLIDLINLSTISTLTTLSLTDNAVCLKPHYRAYLIHILPNLKLLDYTKVTLSEREKVMQLFSGEEGKTLLKSLETDTYTTNTINNTSAVSMVLTESQKQEVRAAIERATSREEIDIIEKQLKVNKH